MTTCEELVFYWDSGASQWWLRPGTVANAKNIKSTTRVEGAYGQLSAIKEKGSIKTYKGDIEVFTVENNTVNLASVSKTCKDLDINMMFNPTGVWEMRKVDANANNYTTGRQIGTLCHQNGLYKITNEFFIKRLKQYQNCKMNIPTNYRMTYQNRNPARVAHLRLGCINARYLKEAITRQSILGLDNITPEHLTHFEGCPCLGCVAAHRAKFSTSRRRGKAQESEYRTKGRTYHKGEYAIDFAGPIPQGRLMHRHIFFIMHLESAKCWTYGAESTKTKHLIPIMRRFLNERYMDIPSGYTPCFHTFNDHWQYRGVSDKGEIQLIRQDGGTSFDSAPMRALLESYKIKTVTIAPYLHYQNPCERVIQTINRIAVSQLANAKFKDDEFKLFYFDSVEHATMVYNMRPHSRLGYKTPIEAYDGYVPHINMIRIFGSTAFTLLSSMQRPNGKYSRRFETGILLGMLPTPVNVKHPIYKICIPYKPNRIYMRGSVILDETLSHSANRYNQLRNGNFYIDLNENEYGQVLLPTQLPPFEGVDNWTLSNGMTYELHLDGVKAIGKIPENTNWIRDECIHICSIIIVKHELTKKLETANIKLQENKLRKENKLRQEDKLRRSKRKQTKTKWVSMYSNKIDHKQAWLDRRKNGVSDKLRLLKVEGDNIEVEISSKFHYNFKMRKLKNKRKKSRYRPNTFDDNVKLSDWDNPDLVWAKLRDDWPQWQEAITKEIDQLTARGTWRELTPDEKKKNHRLLDTKLVLKIKRFPNGEIDKYKARLTARGFLQRFNLDYKNTYSPVAHHPTFRLVLADAKRKGRKTALVDFIGAFLYPWLKHEIYIKSPDQYKGTGFILKLLKTLYGLKQAGHEWYELLKKVLKEIGFVQADEDVDSCLFKHEEWDIVTCIHVDDCLASYTDSLKYKKFLKVIKEKGFDFTESEKVLRALGLKIVETENTITIVQPAYVAHVLKELDLEEIIEKDAPPHWWCEATKEEDIKFDEGTYRTGIGCLAYLARMTRPDIEQYVFHLATFVSNPSIKHWDAFVHLMGYLKKYHNLGITFDLLCKLWAFYVDADWAGDSQTRKSTTGYIIQFMGGPLITKSVRQRIVTTSSTEAEYCAFTDILKDIKWVRKLCKFLDIEFPTPAPVFNDNLTAQNLATGQAQVKRTKHIDVRYHFIKEAVKMNIVELIHVPRADNIADLFTHPTTRQTHRQMRHQVMNLDASVNDESTKQHMMLFCKHHVSKMNNHQLNLIDNINNQLSNLQLN